jgi:DNA-binding FadR family transcriptional regulator
VVDRTSAASLSQPSKALVSFEGHRVFSDAINAGDEEAAATKMGEHIEVSGQSVYQPKLR